MADKGYVDSLLNRADDATKAIFKPIFDHVLSAFRIGNGDKATNFQWYRLEGTTDAVANTEFSIEHGIGAAPSLLIPVLDLTSSGAQLVPLTVSRAADSKRVYLKSSSTSAAFTCYVE